MQDQLGPPILVGRARKTVFNSPTPLLTDDNVSVKKYRMTLRQFSSTHGLGLKPTISFTLLYK